jgi:SOS response regulatory protein OraA/RecX
MQEPLVRIVSRRTFFTAVDDGLARWIEQEQKTPGKANPKRALSTAALNVLRLGVEQICANARELVLISVHLTNKDIEQIVVSDRVSNVRYRLKTRIGGDAKIILYAETNPELDAGAVWVRPVCHLLNRNTLRISVEVSYFDERYLAIGTVRTEPPQRPSEQALEDPYPPEYRARLAEEGRRFYRYAATQPAMGERVKQFLEDIGISIEALAAAWRVRRTQTVEVIRLGRIDIVDVGMVAVPGGGVAVLFEERHTEPGLQRIDGTPDVAAILRDRAAFEQAQAEEALEYVFDVLAATTAPASELSKQQAVVNRASEIGLSAIRPVADYLQRHGAIDDAEGWLELQAQAIVESRRADSLEGIYRTQVRRRQRGVKPRVTFLEKQLETIAARELPAQEGDPERAVIRAAQEALTLYAQRPVFVPPLDQFVDNSLMWILLAARSLDRARSGPAGS